MSELVFRLANISDKANIIAFMDANWGSAHPLVHNDALFDYYYKDESQETALQFALCENDSNLLAIAGYIKASHSENPDIWVSIWCAVKGQNGTGLELMAALPRLCGARVMACNNIREKTMPFYTFLGYAALRLPHYYRLRDIASYKIARVNRHIVLPAPRGKALQKITDKAYLAQVFTPCEGTSPNKDLWYLQRRYFDYPYQKYDIYALMNGDGASALLVTRTVNVEGTNVLRIVDYVGKASEFAEMGYGIDLLIREHNAEYADMYCYGIDADIIARAGLVPRKVNDDNIIPNYLSPPIYENTEYFFFTSNPDGFMMFKADGDQDRANIK